MVLAFDEEIGPRADDIADYDPAVDDLRHVLAGLFLPLDLLEIHEIVFQYLHQACAELLSQLLRLQRAK